MPCVGKRHASSFQFFPLNKRVKISALHIKLENFVTNELATGSRAPAFTLPADGGEKIALKDLRGKIVVLYFYPKDDTSGCTKQAIGFSESLKAFTKEKAIVIGVSKDSVEKHDKFKKKHKLKISLASDETGKVLEKYGVWRQKTLYGRQYMGIERSTFLIDGAGKINRIWRKVRVPGHVDDVLEAVRAL